MAREAAQEYSLSGFDPKHGRKLTSYVILRGNIPNSEVEKEVNGLKNSSYYVEWIPSISSTMIRNIGKNNKDQPKYKSLVYLQVNSAVKNLITRFS